MKSVMILFFFVMSLNHSQVIHSLWKLNRQSQTSYETSRDLSLSAVRGYSCKSRIISILSYSLVWL